MSFNAKDMTQGGQIANMRFRMFGQIANIIFYVLFIIFWVLCGLILMYRLSWQTFVNGCVYWWCTTLAPMRDIIRSQPVYTINYYGKSLEYNSEQILADKYTIWCGEQLWTSFVFAAIVSLTVCIVTFFVASWVLGRQGKQQSEDENTGGRQLSDKPKEVARQMKRDGVASDIKIGDLPILKHSEIQNFCLHGTVGSGKSEVIRRLLNYVRARGDMAIIYDRSCEFVKSYYDPSLDKILNPLDSRCAAWDIWRECLTLPDFDNVSNTLIPMGTKEDPFWQGSGRTIFSEGAYLMREDKDRSYEKLVDTMLSIKIDKLRAYLKNTPAANLVEEKIEKTAISIRAVLTNYVKAIRYLQGIEKNGEPFTIRDWMRGVREDQPNGWLFISSNADTHASLKPVISMWLSIAIRGLLGMGENRNRRVWIFADELPTLHKLPDLVEILPEARKFGGCYVFGIQSYAQLEDIYGVKPAATLFDVMNTRAFFRSPSKEIAEFAAGEIGEKEILKASEQYSYGADPVRDGVSTGKEKERETLVSYSDIQTLPDLSCYVTLPGPYPAVKLALKYKSRPKIAEGFILRNLDTRTDARLDTLLEAREAESSHARTLFTPDAPAPELAEKDEKVGNPPEQSQPAESSGTPATVKVPSTAKTPEADESGQSPEVSNPAALLTKVVTVPLTRPRPAAATGTAAVASATDVRATPAGGTEQALETQPAEQGQDMLPPGVNEYGEIDDMHAWDEWQSGEQTQRDMQRREEVNINHSHRRDEQDDIEIGGNF
ncbi:MULTISPECIES: type IV conjugative transfer system coupling protein TraD [Enterobacteriaceae]|jgi:type IV conjugative transfer system coupling protein TraD|uniref:Type IV conjugative transfer system coupling protein TraD n=28 Tax=Enterobacteriaceae TaxID=543 RepID=A0AA44NMV8_CITFR|nr:MULTISPECIES: type IV conjugative transfer system coupling protein TraD [Enterobacteriaceae]MXF49803.1 type IV conjugative transfer system coupling protein TraD [Raoultella sp. Lac2]MXG01933.1 type IV conjugative transfer system coupling protein TraD [Raoultella sp. Lac1]HDT5884000.1 type IV conjugative transfer system coupling protein TraD [Klebsiella pneumoniae subsp. pneumoniae]AKN19698.1 DNA transport protein TraD [Enterobacter cloacae]AQZ21224.1 DNA transport protein TraD [Enterobacter